MQGRYEYKISEAGIKKGVCGWNHQGKSYKLDLSKPQAILEFRLYSENEPLKDPEAHCLVFVRFQKA